MKRTALFALALSTACAAPPNRGGDVPPHPTSEPPESPPDKPIDPRYPKAGDADVDALVASNNAFAADLYAQLRGRQGDFAASPASIALALGMTYAGAKDRTAEEMRSALHLSLEDDRVHRAYGTLLRVWNAPAKRPYQLSVANRLFGEQTMSFEPDFLSLTAGHYAAELDAMSFKHASESARQSINAWIEKHTMKRILNLMPEGSIDADTKLVLANAIYFKGKWMTEFDKSNTRPEDFHAPGGVTKTHMMHLTSDFQYGHEDGVQMLEMGYQGKDLSMTVLLPDDKDGLGALEQRIVEGSLERWRASMRPAEVAVSLPRFKIDPAEPIALTKILSSLGINDAFDPDKADFSGMSSKAREYGLHISSAFHKAFVEVNEEGTEAAAATGIAIGTETTSVDPGPVEFRADHPFVFLIRDKWGTILFIGRVAQPSAA